MRIANLVSLRIDGPFRRVLRGRERVWLISIPANEVKNSTELTYELPTASHGMIDAALVLYDQPDGWLFRPKLQ